ncbi:hypothetical protein [Megamonas funiformis]|uniref:hypothetical protein n=1 Tax=Megamonas funiformis TaxID=437897 RepID=UPI0026DB3561|nr:hypothetical protein [Megamonas funiformis]
MSRVNVKQVILSPKFRQVYTVTRTKGHYEKGKFILDEPIKFDISGVITVASAKEVNMIPEGDKINGAMVFYSLVPLHTTTNNPNAISDIIEWQNNKYKIMQVNPWIDYGYYQAVAVRMEGY